MAIQIVKWKKPEPTLQLKFYRLIRPYAKLLDALISILTISQIISNFELEVTERSMRAWYDYLKLKKFFKDKIADM